MEPSSRNIDSLFHAAIRIEDFDERARDLDVHCRDPRVRTEIERLLEAHEGSGSFLSQPPPSFDVTEQHDPVSGNRISVLKALGRAFGVNPSVSLHDAAELAEDPVQHLSSDELPRGDAGNRYQLFGEIARGGMGAVIKGRDTDLGRDLAVKVLLKKHRQRPEAIQRFVEEAQIGGQLQHPAIAPVYELGQFDDQRPYFTMKKARAEEERKRRRVTSALALTVLTLVLAISGGGLWLQTQKAVAANEVAVAASRLAEKEQEKARLETEAKEELRWVLYRSDIRRVQTALEAGNHSAVKEILAQHIPQPGQRDLRGFEWHYLYRRCPVPQQSQVFPWEDDALWEWQYQVSGDGNRIAAIISDEDGNTPLIGVGSTKTGKREWSTHLDVPTDQPELRLPSIDEWAYWQLNHDGSIAVVERTAEGEGATTKTITMWKLDHNGEIVDLYRSTKNEELKQWYVSPSEAKVVGIVGVRSEEDETIIRDELRIWDQTTREEKRIQRAGQIPPGRFWHSRLAFSGDGKVLGEFTHPMPQDAADTKKGLPIEGELSVYDTATLESSLVKSGL